MATLRIQLPGKGPKVYHLYKKITSLGRGEENDIVLPDPLLGRQPRPRPLRRARLQRHVDRARRRAHVNGKKRNKHRLVHEDRIRSASSS